MPQGQRSVLDVRMRERGERACAGAQLGTRPDCALRSTAAWGMVLFPGLYILYLLGDQGIYIHGSTRLQRLDLHVDQCILFYLHNYV